VRVCFKCHKEFEEKARRCPHCGARNRAASGVFQTSTVLISTEGKDRIYRSVEEVPPTLRNRLLRTTNSANADTILIADRKGREEIDKAMRRMPGSAPRRQFGAILGKDDPPGALSWLTPPRRRWLNLLVLLLALAVIAFVFLHTWK
jgi:hypothetical protein